MKHKLINEAPERTYAVVFETGDEALAGLARFAADERLDAARFTGIGAFDSVVLGFFDLQRKDYERIPIDEQVEAVALVGDVALGPDGVPKVHAHVVVAKRDGSAWGGHLLQARVRPTLEVMLVESPSYLRRRTDPATGLALIVP
ncbi:MAG: DNA-binding protein [Rubrivivax sp.]|nr:DNA-binding protein [Rubrivivax sp.]